MKLSDALKLHLDNKSSGAESNVFGNGYLLKRNIVFKKLNSLVKKKKYKYVPAWDFYQKAWLYELPTILKSKKIPVNQTEKIIKELVQKRKVDQNVEAVPVNWVSYHFHESAHVLAFEEFKKLKITKDKEKILIALLSESFANAVESFSISFLKNESDIFFFNQLSYIHGTKERMALRLKILKKFGPEGLFRLIFLSYLYANFLIDEIPKQELIGVFRYSLKTSNLNESDLENLKRIFKQAYDLNPEFRTKTVELYLQQLNIKGSALKNLGFDFIKIFLNRPDLVNSFEKLVTTIAT